MLRKKIPGNFEFEIWPAERSIDLQIRSFHTKGNNFTQILNICIPILVGKDQLERLASTHFDAHLETRPTRIQGGISNPNYGYSYKVTRPVALAASCAEGGFLSTVCH